jgi:hypothetical protein
MDQKMSNGSFATNILQQISSARDVTAMPNPNDIAEAIRLAKGNPSLIALIKRADQTARSKFRKKRFNKALASRKKAESQDSIADSKDYLINQDIKESEETASKLEAGTEVSTEELLKMVSSHCSKDARKIEAGIEKKIMSEIFSIHQNAANNGEDKLNEEEMARRNALRAELELYKKRAMHEQVIDNKIGKNLTSKTRDRAVRNNADEIIDAIKKTKESSHKVISPMLDDIFNRLDQDLERVSKMSVKDKGRELKYSKKEFSKNLSKLDNAVKELTNSVELPRFSIKKMRAALREARVKSSSAVISSMSTGKKISKYTGVGI